MTISVTSNHLCPQCGREADQGALWGLCTQCLLSDTLPASSGPATSIEPFAGYILGHEIGRGGMGRVFQATQLRLGRSVAIKLIVDGGSASTEARRRFQIEAEAAAKLDHPNIVPIYEVGEFEGQPFLSMKLIVGETLGRKIASGEYSLLPRQPDDKRVDFQSRATRIAQLMATLARAVQHAHDHRVLHRDLKPGNILIDHEGRPFLTDFGLAKILNAGLEDSGKWGPNSGVAGTVCYMSPEQGAGGTVSVASDVYSLGTVLYEMLTGALPFKAETLLASLNRLQTEPPRRPRTLNHHIDRDLETICLKCLEKNPAARYTSAGALADDLERWLRREPIKARPAGIPLRLRRWVQRNKLATAFIFTLLLSLAMALGIIIENIRKERLANEERARLQRALQLKIAEFWNDHKQSYIPLKSWEVEMLAGLPPRKFQPFADTLTLGEIIADAHEFQIVNYGTLLVSLSESMSEFLDKPVNIDLRLYKFIQSGDQSAVTRSEVDFQRLGAVRYIQARQEEPQLQLIARELPDKEGVFFASGKSGITNLSQCVGKRVAFADPHSTITVLAQAVLARAGITTKLLREVDYFPIRAPGARFRTGTNVNHQPAHDEVLRKVVAGDFDAGEAARIQFKLEQRRSNVIELCSFKVPPDVIVARAGLDMELVAAFDRALRSVPTNLFSRLKRGLDGFAPVDDKDYDGLRLVLTNEVPLFNSQAVGK